MAAVYLEYKKDNYWTSERMLAHLEQVIAIRKKKYPWARVTWRFDHSTNHTKKAEDALNANVMNNNDGGRVSHAFMRDAVIMQDDLKIKRGEVQKMTTTSADGKKIHKGLVTVLEERIGKEATAAIVKSDDHDRAWHLKKALKKHVDFRDAPTLIHDLIKQHCPHDTVRFYPKCHCELPAVERFFCEHKRYARANTRFNLPGLRQIASQGLDAVCKESVRRHFGLCRRYEKAMIDGVPLMSRDKVVKENRYTSHRRTKKSAETAPPGAFTQLDIAPNNLCFCSTCCDERLPQVASNEGKENEKRQIQSICDLNRCQVCHPHFSHSDFTDGKNDDAVRPRFPYPMIKISRNRPAKPAAPLVIEDPPHSAATAAPATASPVETSTAASPEAGAVSPTGAMLNNQTATDSATDFKLSFSLELDLVGVPESSTLYVQCSSKKCNRYRGLEKEFIRAWCFENRSPDMNHYVCSCSAGVTCIDPCDFCDEGSSTEECVCQCDTCNFPVRQCTC